MKTSTKFLLIGGGILLVFCCLFAALANWLISTGNTAGFNDEAVNKQWSNVGIQIQRRADMYKTYVAGIVGASAQESDIMQMYRDQAAALSGSLKYDANGDPIPPQNQAEADALQAQLDQYNQALAEVMVYFADNPDEIKSLDLYERFLVEVEGTENRIATERRYYNDMVEIARKHCRPFPNNLACSVFGYTYTQWAYFEPSADSEVPEVDFSQP